MAGCRTPAPPAAGGCPIHPGRLARAAVPDKETTEMKPTMMTETEKWTRRRMIANSAATLAAGALLANATGPGVALAAADDDAPADSGASPPPPGEPGTDYTPVVVPDGS